MSTPPPLPPEIAPPRLRNMPPVLPPVPPQRRKPSKAGKVIGIVAGSVLALFLAFFGFRICQFIYWSKHHAPTGADFFRAASKNIGPSGVAASGNSATAKSLAATMSSVMLEFRNAGIEQADKKALLDKSDQFKTYCDLRSNQCVFLIHAPEMRRFTQEAQDTLALVAWESAQATLTSKKAGGPEMKLAVGMMGLVSYERVMFGKYVSKVTDENNGLEETARGFGSERGLYDWFKPDSTLGTNSASAD